MINRHTTLLIGILLSTSAIAGDLPSKKKTPEQPVKVVTPYNWTGTYVGVNAGLLMDPSLQKIIGANQINLNGVNVNQSVMLPTKFNKVSTLFAGGLVIGYNYQYGNFVYGAEADIMALSASKSARSLGTYTSAGNPYTSSSSGKISQSYLSTLRYKAGYAIDDILVYGTAGFAMANVKTKSSFQIRDVTNGPPDDVWTGSKNSMRYGYSLGGGVEYAYTKNITIKAEYLHYNLGKIKYSTAPDTFTTGDQPGAYQNIKSKVTGNIIRIGLNYKF